jgi:hypothetical protein
MNFLDEAAIRIMAALAQGGGCDEKSWPELARLAFLAAEALDRERLRRSIEPAARSAK